jgi:hypothetical protein
MKRYWACAFLAAALPASGLAHPQGAGAAKASDRIVFTVGDKLPRAALLTAGTHRYLRYIVKNGRRVPVDIWVRKISFEQRGGRRLVRIWQQWDAPGEGDPSRIEDSVLEAGTMRPISHVRARTQAGKTITSSYLYDGATVTGDAAASDNAAKDFTKTGAAPLYNFVPDIEWLQQLPMSPGRVLVASLYDPGSGEPGEYSFTVAGSERIAGPDGKPVDCWLVTTDYNHPERGVARFWFAKANQQMIRQEADMGERGKLVKTLLPPESGG